MEQGKYGGWIPVVNQRRGGGSRGYEDRRGLFTVFVDNIPSSLDAKSLFKLYNKFGVVSDVYIPSKRRKATNSRFGFVRFDCHVASDMAVQKTNGMLVDDKVLAVKYAAHDRSVSSMRRPQAIIEAPNQNRGKGFSSFIGHKSFAEALSGASNLGDAKASMTVKANEDGHSWLYESVVIRMNSDFSITSIRSALKDIGLDQVVVRKGGGRDVILTFKSKEELQSNIQQIKDRFKDWSQYVLEWRPGILINQERSVWLKCQGIPLNLWNRSNLNSIGALWGSVLQLEGDLSNPKSFSYFRMKVATTCMELISKTIHLECRGKLHPVFVCEDLCVSPVEFNGASIFGLGDCNSSSKEVSSRVEGNDFSEEGCRRKDACDIVAKQVALSVVAVPPSIEVAQRKELTQCNSGETVGTVVEETRSGVEASRPIVVDGKEALSEVGARCSDFSLRCVEQVSATGLCKSLSGSLDGFGPGINLEVALGLPNDELTVHGPSRLSSDLQGKRAPVKGNLFNVGSIGSGTMRLKDQGPVHCPASIHNSNRSTKKAGKKKVQMEGFSRFARLYGHQSAAMEATPKNIMNVMDIDELTLYQLKSHLQKYRLRNSKPHKEDTYMVSSDPHLKRSKSSAPILEGPSGSSSFVPPSPHVNQNPQESYIGHQNQPSFRIEHEKDRVECCHLSHDSYLKMASDRASVLFANHEGLNNPPPPPPPPTTHHHHQPPPCSFIHHSYQERGDQRVCWT